MVANADERLTPSIRHLCARIVALVATVLLPINARGQWVPLGGPPGYSGPVTSFATTNANVFVAVNGMVYRTSDQGQDWITCCKGFVQDNIQILAADSADVVAGANDGSVFLSSDGGETWGDAKNGLPSNPITALAISGEVILAGTSNGLYRSTNHGADWSLSNIGRSDTSITVLSSDTSVIYAGTPNGLYRSNDRGGTWSRVIIGFPDSSVHAIAMGDSEIFVACSDHIYRSENSGSDWIETDLINSPQVWNWPITSIAIRGKNIFAGGGTDGKPYISTDDGSAWSILEGLLPDVEFGGVFLVNGGVVYGGGFRGIFSSTDGGQNWTPDRNGIGSNCNAVVAIGDDVLAAAVPDDIYRFDGKSWMSSNSGINDIPSALAARDSFVLAGAHDSRVFRSSNAGTDWTEADSGLPAGASDPWMNFAFKGGYLFVDDGGLFSSSDGGAYWQADTNGVVATSPYMAITALTANQATVFTGSGDIFGYSGGGNIFPTCPN